MTTTVLLVTPSSDFGEAVRHTVEDSDLYSFHVATSQPGALARAAQEDYPLALIDMAFGEAQVIEIGRSLRSALPEIQLVVLCGDETPPSLDAIRPWALVRIPVHLEDLVKSLQSDKALEESKSKKRQRERPSPDRFRESPSTDRLRKAIDRAFPRKKEEKEEIEEEGHESEQPAWLADVSKAAAHLTRLTLSSLAQAALITRNNEVWAYAGGLSQKAAKEVARSIKHKWDDQKSSDLLCFIRLEDTREQHILYATRLGEDSELALVFESETPLSTIRNQAGQLIHNLENENHTAPAAPTSGAGKARPTGELRAAFEFADEAAEDDENVPQIPPISEILTNVPSPDPESEAIQRETQPPSTSESAIQWPRREQPREAEAGATRMAPSLSNAQAFRFGETSGKGTAEKTGSKATKDAQAKPRQAQSGPAGMDATRASPTTEAARKIALEPISAGLYHLTYACLLIPRFSHHYLTGDLADKLAEWLPNIAVSFGWRLESLAVRPEYLQWVVNVQPNTSPGFVMKTTRDHTNEKIFTTFTKIKRENPSGDFWAPGYLIMGGSNPHPPQLIRDYIKQIRMRQGLEARR